MIGTSSRNDEGKWRKLNTLSNGKCVVGNGIPAAHHDTVDEVFTDDSMVCCSDKFCIVWCPCFSQQNRTTIPAQDLIALCQFTDFYPPECEQTCCHMQLKCLICRMS